MSGAGRLSDKSVLVTGGASGMGAAIARLFASEGAHVIVGDVDADNAEATAVAIRETGAVSTSAHLDVLSEASVERAFLDVTSTEEHLDVLVNCAGISPWGRSETLDIAEWRRCIDVNLTGTYLCCRAAGALMIPRQSGVIVNFGSTASVAGVPGMAAYSAAKHGVVGLTKALAVEWGGLGVRVNCICPGATSTAMLEGLSEVFRRERLARIPLRRFGEPREQAAVALFLACEDSSYVNGAVVCVDGGVAAIAPGTSDRALASVDM